MRATSGAGLRTSAVAAVALSRLRLVLRMLPLVGGEAAADVDRFLELTLLVAAHVALVGSGIDQLAFAGHGPGSLKLPLPRRNPRARDLFQRPGQASHEGRRTAPQERQAPEKGKAAPFGTAFRLSSRKPA
ncbi:MAG: hypothetical protein JWO81_529 [Alphaproteobacteria bacterium]|nr:hypothetical protein [Alphaproteobacteria bacterium]